MGRTKDVKKFDAWETVKGQRHEEVTRVTADRVYWQRTRTGKQGSTGRAAYVRTRKLVFRDGKKVA